MRVGLLLPGFSSDEQDWAIPVQLNLVREMAQADAVRVLALRYPHRRDRYPIHGATVHSLGVGQVRGWSRLRLWWDAMRTLRQLHQQEPFDVLHAMWADETGLLAVWAGRWLGIPSVVSIAGGELIGLDDIAYGLQRSRFSRWVVGQALRADCVTAACAYVRQLIVRCGYEVPDKRLRTVVLGVDPAVFHPADNPDQPTEHRLIHVASLVGVKDQATLLRALARLPASVNLDIVGTGPEEMRLRTLATTLGIADRVRWVGAAQHLDLPHWYRQAALNLLTSRHEGLGMVTLEAAACGVPTISTAVGLLPDVPELGLTVPVGDDAALAAAIETLLHHPGQRLALGQSALKAVRERFTIQHTVEQFRAIYAELGLINRQ